MQIDSLDQYPIYAKTDWVFSKTKTEHIGWYVGWVDHEKGEIFFATRIQPKKEMDLISFPS